MAAASLAVRISAQIAEFQKAFAESSKTLDGFKGDFNKTSAAVQTSVDKMSTSLDSISSKITAFGKPFGAVGAAVSNTVNGLIKTFGSLGTAAGVIGAGLAGIGIAVGVAVAAFKILESAATAAFDFVKGAVTDTKALGEQLYDMSKQTGITVESLSGLQFIAGQTGVSLEAITGAVFKMQTNLGQGSEKTKKAIADLGLSFADLKKQAPEEALAKTVAQINKLPNASAQAAAGVAIFGKQWKEISLLKGENLDELMKKARELGLIMSTETAVAADMLGDAMDALEKQMDGFRRQIGAKLIPVVLTFVEVFGGIFSDAFRTALTSFQGAGKGFDTFVGQIGNGVASLIEVFALMLDGIATWATGTILRTQLVAFAMLTLTESTLAAAKAAAFLTGNFAVSAVFGAVEAKVEKVREAVVSMTAATLTGGAAVRRFATEVAAATQNVDFGKAYQKVLADIAKAADELREKLRKQREGTGTEAEVDKATEGFAKSLEKLTRQIEIAKAAGTPFAELVRLFGKAAAEAVPMADALGISVRNVAREVAAGFNLDKATAALAKFRQEVDKTTAATREDIRLRVIVQGIEEGKRIIDTINDVKKAADRLADIKMTPFARELAQLERARRAEIAAIEATADADSALRQQQIRDTNAYYDHLRDKALGTFDTLEERMRDMGVLTKDANKDIAAGFLHDYQQMLASGKFTAEQLTEAWERYAEAMKKAGEKATVNWLERFKQLKEKLGDIVLTFGQDVVSGLAHGIETGDWEAVKQSLTDALTDVFANVLAAVVDFVVPGLGKFLQPLFKALGKKIVGWLGLDTAGRDAVKEFAKGFGGFDELRQQLRTLGEEGEALWVNLTQRVSRGSEEQAAAAIDAINAAFKKAEEGMKNFADGAMKRIKAFSAAFKTATGESLVELKKLVDAEMPELEMGVMEMDARKALDGFLNQLGGTRAEIQEEFNLLGLYAGTAFAETLRDQGLAAALEVARPMFDELNTLGQEFGFTLEGSAGKFAAFFEAAAANEDVIGALEGITLMIQGAGDAAFLTQELFSAFSTDAVAQFTRLSERGVEANQVMAFMQPTLQALWEAQQKFGFETDKATQALIDQGVEQGIVGANMKDVNEKILDVLLAIAKVFKADIPAGLDATAQKSKQTADTMARDFDAAGKRAKDALKITVPDIEVKVNYRTGDVEKLEFEGLKLATGGIVRKPTFALLGEAGPELVIPLQRLREMAFLDGLRDRYGIPGLQHGGIVRSPTLALVGEAGPEAVIPLSQMGATGPDGVTVILEIDGRAMGEVVIPHLAHGVTRLGLGF